MNIFLSFLFFLILLLVEITYFKIADIYNIIDRPNHRSSHTKITIRGGGLIFPIGFLLASFYLHGAYTYFILGLMLISIISFIDDINDVGKRIRIAVHLVSVALLFYQLSLFNQPWYWIVFGIIFVIGIINAINFMDGINGITGAYGLTSLLTLYYINNYIIAFTDNAYLVVAVFSLLVFNFFNFRTKAKCFAGDVGSVSVAFIIAFFLLQLIFKTSNLNYLFLLLVYGLDTSTTILFRVVRKEKILEAHRTHFYQFLSNEKKIPHLIVAGSYAIIQLSINVVMINLSILSTLKTIIIVLLISIVFVLMRLKIEGLEYLTRVKK